jgi:hypothetical protein
MSFTFYLQPVTDGRVDSNGVFAALLTDDLLLLLPLDVHLVVRQCNVEVQYLIAFVVVEADESVVHPAALNVEHEVAGGVEHGLDDALPLARGHEAGSEEISHSWVLETDLAVVAAGHDTEAARPDLVPLQPLAALAANTGGKYQQDLSVVVLSSSIYSAPRGSTPGVLAHCMDRL